MSENDKSLFSVRQVYTPESDEVRKQLLAQHREWLQGLEESDLLVAGGMFPGTNEGLLLIRADDEDEAVKLLNGDPFFQAGTLERRDVDQWKVVIGSALSAME